jgi:glycerophosphoryl diester phosphodiesterase
MPRPLVIAHRGASGYRPENTIEAFELGIAQGADGLEFDLVNTKDQRLIIRHENAVGHTTNIADIDEFSSFRRTGQIDTHVISEWFSEDLTLEQIKSLAAIERLPELRPGSALFDGQYKVPTFSELLSQEFIRNKTLVVELKRGTHTNSLSRPIGEIAAEDILNSNILEKNVDLILESFDYEILMGVKKAMLDRGLQSRYFLALEKTKLKKLNLKHLSEEIHGLAIPLKMLFGSEPWVDSAHKVGLQLWAYTARAEKASTSVEAYYEEIIQTGVDGIFADQPDLLVRVLNDRG